jgi:hypothetical protein
LEVIMKIQAFAPLACLLTLVGCEQTIDVDPITPPVVIDVRPPVADDPPGDVPDEPPPPSAGPIPFVRLDVRRLTLAEVRQSLLDVIGVDVGAELGSIAPDPLKLEDNVTKLVFPFDNLASQQTSSLPYVDSMKSALDAAADRFVADDALRSSRLPCAMASVEDEACLRDIIAVMGRRLWRRPLGADEITSFVGAMNSGRAAGTANETLVVVMRALLLTPDFLFRIEQGVPDEDDASLLRLDSFEVASRLSFLAWGAGPDDVLLDAAAANELGTPNEREQQLQRLLSDARASRQLGRFHSMWFGYERPQLPSSLIAPMRAEADALVERVTLTDRAPWREVLTRTETFVDDSLAEHYGLQLPGGGPAWVSTEGSGRGGLLGQGSFLANGAKFGDTSPTTRGAIIQTLLFCASALHPDPSLMVNVDEAPAAEEGQSNCKIDRYARHRNDGACSGCHAFLDGTGFGLENFDATGAHRTTEAGAPECTIDGTGSVPGEGDFSGPGELGALLASSDGVNSCLVTQLVRFATGHRERDEDTASITRLTERFVAAEGRLDWLMADVVRQPFFVFRHVDGGAQ